MTKVISFRRKKGITHKTVKRTQKPGINTDIIKNEKNKFLLTVVSIAALLCGSLIYRFFPDQTVNSVINENVNLFQSGGFTAIFLTLIKLDLAFIIASFFLGTSFIGATVSFIPPALKCILIGYIGSYFYNEFELKGVLFCLLLLYPYFVITTASLIFASNENIYMSNYTFGMLRNKSTADDISIRLYLIRYLILIVINLACSAVNSGLICFLAPRINLG